jgi:dipeptidyl aminopeptidase/acylaminoacyl peptidase
MHRGLDLEALIPGVLPEGEGFHVSPDGRNVAFAWDKTGQWQVYLVELQDRKPTRLSSKNESCISPRFSPDGRFLAYAQDFQGDEKFDIFVLNLDSKEERNITPGTDEMIQPFIRWSPDGKMIAMASDRSGKFSTYSLPTVGGKPRLLCDHKYDDFNPDWSSNGRWIMFTSMTKGQDQGVFIVPADGGEARQLGDENGPIDASMPQWSPDSRRIAFASSSRGMSDIGIYNLADGKVEWLTDSTLECYDPCWSPDGLNLAYRQRHEGDAVMALQRIGGEKRVFQLEPGVHTRLSFTPDSRHLVFTFSSSRRPVDLWTLDIEKGEFCQLTSSLSSSVDPEVFVSPTPVRYGSAGGLSIPAQLYRPPSVTRGKEAPGVVYVHGGPESQHENDWYPDVQDLVARGFVVLAPNYRGSTGYGRSFRHANRFVMGTDDLADIVAAADFLVNQHLVDPKRVAVTGLSYGGYMTMCALTKFPDRWAAGSALFPFLNWFTEFENEREDLRYWDRENMGIPSEDPERFREASPIFFMDRVQAPVQLVAGTQDSRCPLSESVQARDALHKLGKPVDFIVYADEGHSFAKVRNRADCWKRRAIFLEKHLGKR